MSASDTRQQACLNAIDAALAYLRRQPDAQADVEALNERFCSAGAILEAGEHVLMDTELTQQEAKLLTLIPALARSIERSAWGSHPRLDGAALCTRYLNTLFLGVPIERFYALSLNAAGQLLEVTKLGQGTLDETPFYLGALLKCAVETRAEAIVLSHNHPGGTLRPSRADVECTLQAQRALKLLGIPLIDHIIVADGQGVSLRQNGFIRLDEEQGMTLNVNWLSK